MPLIIKLELYFTENTTKKLFLWNEIIYMKTLSYICANFMIKHDH